jgi:sugar phosphate isomerase/epimerase
MKIGKKTKEWMEIRKELKEEFQRMGVTTCELKLEGCTHDNFLGFAHTKKRRNVTDLKRVVLACANCHDKVEYCSFRWTGKPMEEYLEGIISKRA